MSRKTDQIESLLKLAGERDQPTAEGLAQARQAAHAAWQRGLAHPAPVVPRKHRATSWMIAAAASVVLLVAALVISGYRGETAGRVLVARVALASGTVTLDGQAAALTVAAPLLSGSELSTRQEPIALRVGDVLSLRLQAHTRVRFEGPGHISLLAGAVYVDSGGLNAPSALRIGTPAGEVRHIGTQFQVAVDGGTTRVQVREGRVVVGEAGASLIELGAGDRLIASGAGARIDHGIPGFGGDWNWAARAVPPMDIENRPLSEFLGWYTREHGLQLRFVDARTQAGSVEIRLHGSLAGIDSRGSLEYVGLITGVPLSVRDGVLWAGRAP